MKPTIEDSSFERIVSAVMVVVFWVSFAALAGGLLLWLRTPASGTAALALAWGLLGLLLIPLLRVICAIATAAAHRDRVMLAATLAVLAILLALTLRDASGV